MHQGETGLYELILQSRKPQAVAFKKWVTGTVLPAIRKTGGYVMGEKLSETEDELILRAVNALTKKVEAYRKKNTALTRKVEALTKQIEEDLSIDAFPRFHAGA